MFILVLIFTGVTLWVYFWIKNKYPKGYPPGPTGLPIIGYLPWLAPDPHVKIGKLGKKYGNIFSLTLGSYEFVVLNDLETIKTAFKMEVFSGRPNHLLAMTLVKSGLTYNEGPSLVEQRRFVLRTLRDFGFGKNSMEAKVQEEITELLDHFRSQGNQPVATREILSISVLNALWSIVAGERFALNDPTLRKLLNAGRDGFTEAEVMGILYVVPWLAKLLPGPTGFTKMKNSADEVLNMLREIVIEHQRTFDPAQPRDYIDTYLAQMAQSMPGSSFYKETGIENLVDGLCALLMAGYDTITATMEFTLLYLLAHPDVCIKLQSEIDRVVGRSRVPSIKDRPSMPYMEAVMHESMRFASLLPSGVVHKTTETITFMGYNIPKRTIIMPNLYRVHHNEEYWKDPEVFRPERFINPDGTFRKDENVIPFSVGKRMCIAETIAMTEYFLFLSNILQTFDIVADPNNPLPSFEAEKSALVLYPKPYKLIFKERS